MTDPEREIATLENRIDGSWVGAGAGEVADDCNPADLRDVVARVPQMTAPQASMAVDVAAEAAAAWRERSPLDRATPMMEAARLLRERTPEIAADITREMGKTIAEATGEVGKSAEFLEFYAGTARLALGDVLADGRPGTMGVALTEPVGVVAAITPWNDPMLTPARKLGPALIAGNTVVLKPASDTPLAALHLVRALVDAGLPDGVLNTVTGSGGTVGAALIEHPRVAAVTFTGSTETGLHLRRQLASTHVRLQAELGGKNAAVVLADADLDLAVGHIVAAGFGGAGQRCTATSRLIVEASVYDEVLERLVARVQAIRIGPGSDPASGMGPVVNARARDELLASIELAAQAGAVVAAGGGTLDDERLAHGCFVAPTVLTEVTAEMPVWSDELFGPVLAVRRVDSFEAAVAAVNDSPYGLASAVYTRDLTSAHRFIRAVDAGQVSVNLPTTGWDVHQPFGGFKASGSPFKEQGVDGLRFYTRTKMAAIGYGA